MLMILQLCVIEHVGFVLEINVPFTNPPIFHIVQ